MKRIKFLNMILLGGALLATTSCSKYLDVNDNPNNPVDASPDLILPAALAQTAANNVTFNSYGAWVGGYQANAGGYGGFGSVLTYNYATSDNNGLWSSTYSNLNSYQTIINKTNGTGPYKNYFAIAKIMKAFSYLRLIDVYNDVPYTDALKGIDNLAPKYDKAEDVYVALFGELNEAIAALALPNTASTVSTATSSNSQRIDILTSGQSDAGAWEANGYPTSKWTAFANTLKLKMLVRIRKVGSLSSTYNTERAKLANATFVTYDVKTQPGYTSGQDGKQNPSFNAYAYNYTGGSAQLTTIPTFYAVGFYDGHKLNDDVRGVGLYAPVVVYRNYSTANQLGVTTADVPGSVTGGQFFTGSSNGAASTGYGTIKGAAMAQPLMLASESYFIQAEAKLLGVISGGALTDADLFARGIRASQRYLLTDQNEQLQSDYAAEPDAPEGNGAGLESYDYYLSQNTAADVDKPYLVNYALATSTEQKLEAIITQKWIAVNYIHSNEGWSDYRRTGFPVTRTTGDKYDNFASTQSISTRADKLPVRVLYPASEYALNAQNVPSGINSFTSYVFYDNDVTGAGI